MDKHGVVSKAAWLPAQVAIVVEFSATDKGVIVLSADEFVSTFGYNLLTAENKISFDGVIGMWLDVSEDGGILTAVKSYPRLILLDEQLGQLVFNKELPPEPTVPFTEQDVIDEYGIQQELDV